MDTTGSKRIAALKKNGQAKVSPCRPLLHSSPLSVRWGCLLVALSAAAIGWSPRARGPRGLRAVLPGQHSDFAAVVQPTYAFQKHENRRVVHRAAL